MFFQGQIQRLLSTQEKRWSAMITLISSLIIVTPLCGFLFQCGCDWPWAGLDSKCNFYKPHIEDKCPWCVSIFMGVLSTGSAIVFGVWVSIFSPYLLSGLSQVNEVLIRIIFGLTVFVGIAFLLAVFAAQWQGYSV